MLKKFFSLFGVGKEGSLEPLILQADMHSHLIPGIDDGVKTIEDSVELISKLSEVGYTKLVTTPHVMRDAYKNTPEIILGGLDDVRKALSQTGIEVEIEASAEYYMDDGFEMLIDNQQLLPFGDNYILFEMSFMNKPPNLGEMVFKLKTQGYKPILAHPERYPYLYDRTLERFEEIRDLGVLLQINLMSLNGTYSIPARDFARKLIDNEMVDLVGSDIHNIGQFSNLKECLKDKYLHKLAGQGKLLNTSL
ncbi:MAG: capsular biosynthesis protein [Bacteroidetes bacterium]|nr:capsular biosynthesis protein [Bacteroidota bacterium]